MRRWTAALAVSITLAACTAADPSTVEGPTVTAPPPPVTAAAEPSTTAAPAQPAPRRTIVVGGTDAVPGPRSPAPAAPAPPTTMPPGTGPVGSAAARFLRPEPARRLVVQVRSVPGAEPQQATLDHLAQVLGSVSGKPVSLVGGAAVEPGDGVWTAAELRAAADRDRLPARDGTAVVRYLFVGGRSDVGEGTVGLAAAPDLAVVFGEQVANAAAEDAVTIHELGHLLGLVDLVLQTGRADPEHPGHSPNRRSVMYWAVETNLLSDLLGGGPPRDFDEDDLADLAAIRRGG